MRKIILLIGLFLSNLPVYSLGIPETPSLDEIQYLKGSIEKDEKERLNLDGTINKEPELGVIGVDFNCSGSNEITKVIPESPADDAGIKSYDKILEVNGVPFNDFYKQHKENWDLDGLIGVTNVPIKLKIWKLRAQGCEPKTMEVWIWRWAISEIPASILRNRYKVQQKFLGLVQNEKTSHRKQQEKK